MFALTASTTLRGFLAHIQSNARQQARLYGAFAMHPDNPDGATPNTEGAKRISEMWEVLRRDIPKVLGDDVQIVTWNELATAPSFAARGSTGWTETSQAWPANDPYRITFGVLKKRADKARRKDPSIQLLGSWNDQSQADRRDALHRP